MDENEALEYFWPALVSRELWKMRKDMLCAVHANSFYAHPKVFAVHERRDAKRSKHRERRKRERDLRLRRKAQAQSERERTEEKEEKKSFHKK